MMKLVTTLPVDYAAFTLTSKFSPDISSLVKFFLMLKMKKYGKFPLDDFLLFLQLMTP